MNDIPDRIIEEERLWRFKSVVLANVDPEIAYIWENPVPVISYASGGRLVGCGVVYKSAGRILAECVTDYAIYERMSVQSGGKIWTLPKVEVTLPVPHKIHETIVISSRGVLHCKNCGEDIPVYSPLQAVKSSACSAYTREVRRISTLALRDDCTDLAQDPIGVGVL